ncbi:MAG: NAD-dependent epimerase/dehydratase family protein [Bacteroidota bacterium]
MILVTGATGLLGAHLLYHLLQTEDKVKALYRGKSKLQTVKNVFSYYCDKPQQLFDKVEWVEAEILDVPSLEEAFVGVTKVYHVAAVIAFDTESEKLMNKVNIEGTANVVNMCLNNSIEKLCHVSSVATLGKTLNGAEITEDNQWNPDADNSGYAISKNGAEMEVWRGVEEGLNSVIVNPSIILGPGFWNSGTGNFFPMVKKGMKFYTEGMSGFVGVNDVAKIMIALMNSKVKHQRFIVSSGNLRYKDIFTSIADNLQVSPPKFKAMKWMLSIAWRADLLKSIVFGTEHKLSKYSARSSVNTNRFNNGKIKEELSFSFQKMEDVIKEVSTIFRKEHQS